MGARAWSYFNILSFYVAKEMYYPINLFNETIYDYNIIYIK